MPPPPPPTPARRAGGGGRAPGRGGGAGGEPVGASLVEWDAEAARAWVFGPWVPGDDAAWARWAAPLLDAALAQLPAGVDRVELGGDVTNVRMAALAGELGWTTSEVSHVFSADAESARSWPGPTNAVRRATA